MAVHLYTPQCCVLATGRWYRKAISLYTIQEKVASLTGNSCKDILILQVKKPSALKESYRSIRLQFLLSLIVRNLFPIVESETEFRLYQQKKTVALVKVKPMSYITSL